MIWILALALLQPHGPRIAIGHVASFAEDTQVRSVVKVSKHGVGNATVYMLEFPDGWGCKKLTGDNVAAVYCRDYGTSALDAKPISLPSGQWHVEDFTNYRDQTGKPTAIIIFCDDVANPRPKAAGVK